MGALFLYLDSTKSASPKRIIIIIIIIIITLFESQIILAEHECCTNWGDCKSNKSNQIKSNQNATTINVLVPGPHTLIKPLKQYGAR